MYHLVIPLELGSLVYQEVKLKQILLSDQSVQLYQVPEQCQQNQSLQV